MSYAVVSLLINKWLEDDKKRRRKQRRTAKRVYDRLVSEYKELGYNCSYRSVALYVSSKKKELYSGKEGYLPLEHPAGEAQVDFGSVEFIENGIIYNGHILPYPSPTAMQDLYSCSKVKPLNALLKD